MSTLDTNYFRAKLNLIIRDLSHYTPQEMARELVRLAKVADENEAVKEAPSAPVAQPEMGSPEGMRLYAKGYAAGKRKGAALSVKAEMQPLGYVTADAIKALQALPEAFVTFKGIMVRNKPVNSCKVPIYAVAPTPPTTEGGGADT